MLSTWAVVAFTVERLVVVRWPLKAIKYVSLRRSRLHLAGLVTFVLAVNTPWFFTLKTVANPCETGTFVCQPTEVLNFNRISEVSANCFLRNQIKSDLLV